MSLRIPPEGDYTGLNNEQKTQAMLVNRNKVKTELFCLKRSSVQIETSLGSYFE